MQFAVSESVVKVLHHLYNCDILSEEFILKWYSTVPDGVDQLQEREELRKKVFLLYLVLASSYSKEVNYSKFC